MGGARIAMGIFEQVAAWNGYAMALYPWTCGTRVPLELDISRSASMMAQAESLGFSGKIFARNPEQLDLDDVVRAPHVSYIPCDGYYFQHRLLSSDALSKMQGNVMRNV